MVVISLHSVFRWYFCCALRIIYHTFYWKNLVESSFPILKQTKNWKDSLLFQSSSFVPISVSRSITCKLTRTLEPRSSTFQVRLQILNIQKKYICFSKCRHTNEICSLSMKWANCFKRSFTSELSWFFESSTSSLQSSLLIITNYLYNEK